MILNGSALICMEHPLYYAQCPCNITCVALYYRSKIFYYTCGSRSFQFLNTTWLHTHTHACTSVATCIFDEFHFIPERTKAPMEVRARKLVIIQNLLKEWLRKRRIRDIPRYVAQKSVIEGRIARLQEMGMRSVIDYITRARPPRSIYTMDK